MGVNLVWKKINIGSLVVILIHFVMVRGLISIMIMRTVYLYIGFLEEVSNIEDVFGGQLKNI